MKLTLKNDKKVKIQKKENASLQEKNTGPVGKNTKNKLLVVITILTILNILTFAVTTYNFIKIRQSQDYLQISTQNSIEKNIQEVKQAISKHIQISETENPKVATIINVESAKKQSPEFYKDAQNGDIVVIYSDKAILYRPSNDLIINISAIIKK